MKKRNPILIVIFSIITFNIYYFYWLASTRKVLNQRTSVKIPTIFLIVAPYVFSILLIPVFIIARVGTSGVTRTNAPGITSVIFFLVWSLVILISIPATFYWIYKFSKSVDAYTSGEMSTVLTFVLMWLLQSIGVAIVQDHFNNMVVAPPASPTNPQAYTPNVTLPPEPVPPGLHNQT